MAALRLRTTVIGAVAVAGLLFGVWSFSMCATPTPSQVFANAAPKQDGGSFLGDLAARLLPAAPPAAPATSVGAAGPAIDADFVPVKSPDAIVDDLAGGPVGSYCMSQAVLAHYYSVPGRWQAQRVLAHTKNKRAHLLIIDIDLTVSDSSARFKRHATDSKIGPGSKVYAEYTADPPLPNAVNSLNWLHRNGFVVVFLSARDYERPYEGTRYWLDKNEFEYDDLIITGSADDKIAIIAKLCHGDKACTIIDDFTFNNHKPVPEIRTGNIERLQAIPNVRVIIFDSETRAWDVIFPLLLAETLIPREWGHAQCQTYACAEAGVPPAVATVSANEDYLVSDYRLADCVHLRRLPAPFFEKHLAEWDFAWLVKETPNCLRAETCLQFPWNGGHCKWNIHKDRCNDAPAASLERSVQGVFAALPLRRHQAVNLIPGFVMETSTKRELCRKVRLGGTGFFPECYMLPEEWDLVQMSTLADGYWIYKPDGNSNGKGITIHKPAADIPNMPGIVQHYFENPLLSPEGFKMDVRVYGVISGVDPLRIYLWSDSYVRVAGARYDLRNFKDQNGHVTNSVANKSYQRYTFTQLRQLITRAGGDFDVLWQRMTSVIVKTILSAAWTMGCNSQTWPFPCGTRHFQPLGIDLTVTDNFEVYMLEINGDPSFKYRNTVISQDDARMYKDLLEMLGFTEAGSFLGVPDISRRISTYCQDKEACCRRLQQHSLTLSLLLAEHQHKGSFRLAFPTPNYKTDYESVFTSLKNSGSITYPSATDVELLDFFAHYLQDKPQELPAGVDATES